jgi:hypothetical protein
VSTSTVRIEFQDAIGFQLKSLLNCIWQQQQGGTVGRQRTAVSARAAAAAAAEEVVVLVERAEAVVAATAEGKAVRVAGAV